MSDTKRKISAWIPAALYDEVEKAGYTSPTIAVTKALELLVRTQPGDNPETIGDKAETVRTQLETENKSLKDEIARLKEVLSNAPNPAELADIKARFEERQTLLDEKDKRIMELTEHKENMSIFANYFKSKAPELIEAPTAEKRKPWYKFW